MGVVEGGGSRCSVVCPCSVLPQTFLFRQQWNLLQDGAPPALPRSASAPPPAEEKTKVIGELEPTKMGSVKEDSVGYRKQVLTSSPAHIRQQEDTTRPRLKTTSLPCWRVTRGKSDFLRI